MKRQYFTLGVLSAVTLLCALSSQAETVTTRRAVSQVELANGDKLDLWALDTNRDGILTMAEVGQELFYRFDKDGNEVIDNREFQRPELLTLIPMKEKTMEVVDLDNDGKADIAAYDYDTFVQASRLILFDQNRNGLSAKEFIDTGFLALDVDDSGVIELDEWENAYEAKVAYLHDEPGIYND